MKNKDILHYAQMILKPYALRALKQQGSYLDNIMVLHSCQYGNLLAHFAQHGVIYPAVTHYSSLADELYYYLQIFFFCWSRCDITNLFSLKLTT